jgi:hypothetical protein
MHEDETQVLPGAAHSQQLPEIVPEHEHGWPGEPNGNAPSQASVVGALRAVRERHAAERQFDLEVPGWLGLLALRLGPIPGAQMARIGERATSSHSPERAFNANADMLIAACRAVLGRARRDDPWTPLLDDESEPVRLDERLSLVLGLEATRAREVVRELYSKANAPDLAVGGSATEYVEWATSTNEDLDEVALGES